MILVRAGGSLEWRLPSAGLSSSDASHLGTVRPSGHVRRGDRRHCRGDGLV